MHFVYILRCADGTLYVGTREIRTLVKLSITKVAGLGTQAAVVPYDSVYSESFETISDALRREYQLEKWPRRKKEALIAGDEQYAGTRAPQKKKNSAIAMAHLMARATGAGCSALARSGIGPLLTRTTRGTIDSFAARTKVGRRRAFEERRSEGVDVVGLERGPGTVEDFGGGVGDGGGDHAGGGEGAAGDGGDAEVGRLHLPKPLTSVLLGSMSRCSRSASWAVWTAAYSWMRSDTASAGEKGHLAGALPLPSEPPSMNSSTRYGMPVGVVPASWTMTMWGCHERRPIASASRSKRARSVSAETGVGEHLDGDGTDRGVLVGPVDHREPPWLISFRSW